MATLRDQLPRPPAPQAPPRLLGEDYHFSPDRLPATRPFRVEHEAVHLLERPLALERVYHLRDPADVQLVVGFRLCWNGSADAVESLFQFVESFQREIPIEAVRRISDEGIGEFGLAWSWDDPFGAEIVAFVRANVLVTVQGQDTAGLPERVAAEVDGELRALRTMEAYPEVAGGAFEPIREKAARGSVEIPAGGRITLGSQPRGERWFFLTTRGSANRDPGAPDTWYYRAGLDRGPAEVRLFRVDPGLVPVLERLTLEIR